MRNFFLIKRNRSKTMKNYLRTILILGLAIALAACSTPAAPTQAPTVNVEPTLNAARTEAAATVAAAIEQQPTATQLPPTATTAATATVEPTVAPANTATTAPLPANTSTSAPTAKPTSAVVVTLAPIEFGCKITASSTTGDTTKAPGSDFDAKWTVKNTGTSNWENGTIDIKYSSGTKMQKSTDVFDLNKAIAVDDTFDVIVDMIAPTTPGNYQTNWAVVRGSTVLCTLPVLITVK
jgi:hypothetical protein